MSGRTPDTVTLTLRAPLAGPLQVDGLAPDRLAAGGDAVFRERYPDNDYFNGRPTGTWAALRGDERAPDAFDKTGRLLAFVLNWDLAETVEL